MRMTTMSPILPTNATYPYKHWLCQAFSSQSFEDSPVDRQFWYIRPRLWPPTSPHEEPMNGPAHWLPVVCSEQTIQRRICRWKEHVLLHPELRQVIVLLADLLAMCRHSDQLAHVSIVRMFRCPLQDHGPAVGRLRDHRFLAHHPLHARVWAAHSSVEHQDGAPGIFNQSGLLVGGEGRFGEEDGQPDADVGTVHEEEIWAALVRRELACVDQEACSTT